MGLIIFLLILIIVVLLIVVDSQKGKIMQLERENAEHANKNRKLFEYINEHMQIDTTVERPSEPNTNREQVLQPEPTPTVNTQAPVANSQAQVVNTQTPVVSQEVATTEKSPKEPSAMSVYFSKQLGRVKEKTSIKNIKEQNQINKNNVVLILGGLFVAVAGLIFATTSWNTLSNFGKIGILLAIAFSFYILSLIAINKLKFIVGCITFYMLGSLFIAITVISIGYLEAISQSFSLNNNMYTVFAVSIFSFILSLLLAYKLLMSDKLLTIIFATATLLYILILMSLYLPVQIFMLMLVLYIFLHIFIFNKFSKNLANVNTTVLLYLNSLTISIILVMVLNQSYAAGIIFILYGISFFNSVYNTKYDILSYVGIAHILIGTGSLLDLEVNILMAFTLCTTAIILLLIQFIIKKPATLKYIIPAFALVAYIIISPSLYNVFNFIIFYTSAAVILCIITAIFKIKQVALVPFISLTVLITLISNATYQFNFNMIIATIITLCYITLFAAVLFKNFLKLQSTLNIVTLSIVALLCSFFVRDTYIFSTLLILITILYQIVAAKYEKISLPYQIVSPLTIFIVPTLIANEIGLISNPSFISMFEGNYIIYIITALLGILAIAINTSKKNSTYNNNNYYIMSAYYSISILLSLLSFSTSISMLGNLIHTQFTSALFRILAYAFVVILTFIYYFTHKKNIYVENFVKWASPTLLLITLYQISWLFSTISYYALSSVFIACFTYTCYRIKREKTSKLVLPLTICAAILGLLFLSHFMIGVIGTVLLFVSLVISYIIVYHKKYPALNYIFGFEILISIVMIAALLDIQLRFVLIPVFILCIASTKLTSRFYDKPYKNVFKILSPLMLFLLIGELSSTVLLLFFSLYIISFYKEYKHLILNKSILTFTTITISFALMLQEYISMNEFYFSIYFLIIALINVIISHYLYKSIYVYTKSILFSLYMILVLLSYIIIIQLDSKFHLNYAIIALVFYIIHYIITTLYKESFSNAISSLLLIITMYYLFNHLSFTIILSIVAYLLIFIISKLIPKTYFKLPMLNYIKIFSIVLLFSIFSKYSYVFIAFVIFGVHTLLNYKDYKNTKINCSIISSSIFLFAFAIVAYSIEFINISGAQQLLVFAIIITIAIHLVYEIWSDIKIDLKKQRSVALYTLGVIAAVSVTFITYTDFNFSKYAFYVVAFIILYIDAKRVKLEYMNLAYIVSLFIVNLLFINSIQSTYLFSIVSFLVVVFINRVFLLNNLGYKETLCIHIVAPILLISPLYENFTLLLLVLAIYCFTFFKFFKNKKHIDYLSINLAITLGTISLFLELNNLTQSYNLELFVLVLITISMVTKHIWYKDYNQISYLPFTTVVFSVFILMSSAVLDSTIERALSLSIFNTATVIYGMTRKKILYFMVSLSSLTTTFLFFSKEFWLDLSWWVFLLVVGVILIAIALVSELKRQNKLKYTKDDLLEKFEKWTLV